MLNPYASFLGHRDPREVIAETLKKIESIGKLPAEKLDAPYAPGKWTGREVLCHLADTEMVFGFRLRQGVAQENHVIQPFDQDGWASAYRDQAITAAAAAATFAAVRAWNIVFIDGFRPEHFSKTLNHPERGEMTLGMVVETMAGHDLNHLAQLERITSQAV